MEPSDEERLAASVRDPHAFAAFYRRHAVPLTAFFLRRTGVMPDRVAAMRMDDPGPGTRTFDVAGNVVVGRVPANGPLALDDARWTFLDAEGREIGAI